MKIQLTKQISLIILLVTVLLLAVAAFFDYPISTFLFNPDNRLGQILASYGETPIFLAISGAGMLLIMSDEQKKALTWILASLLIAVAFLLLIYYPIRFNETLHVYVAVFVSLLIISSCNYLIYWFLKDCEKSQLKKYAYLLLALAVLSFVVVDIMKLIWARPRMRMIAVTPQASFQNFWIVGSGMREKLLLLGVPMEEFKSFPSAHTADAAILVAITALPLLNQKLKNKQVLLWTIALAWTALVAISRIIVGAHFLSDVCVGTLVTLIIYFGLVKIFLK